MSCDPLLRDPMSAIILLQLFVVLLCSSVCIWNIHCSILVFILLVRNFWILIAEYYPNYGQTVYRLVSAFALASLYCIQYNTQHHELVIVCRDSTRPAHTALAAAREPHRRCSSGEFSCEHTQPRVSAKLEALLHMLSGRERLHRVRRGPACARGRNQRTQAAHKDGDETAHRTPRCLRDSDLLQKSVVYCDDRVIETKLKT